MSKNKNRPRAGAGMRRSLTKVGYAHSLAEQIDASYGGQTPKSARALIDRVIDRCYECYEAWESQVPKDRPILGQDGMARIDDGAKVINAVTHETGGSASAYTALALAMLSDAHRQLRSKYAARKRKALDSLLVAVKALHRNYDRRLDKWHEYDAAARAADALDMGEI